MLSKLNVNVLVSVLIVWEREEEKRRVVYGKGQRRAPTVLFTRFYVIAPDRLRAMTLQASGENWTGL
ncbi:hypothetical protein PRIPAC_94808 [Pristionchus pacificus]|uniref:Uncharacterized protein n=1 Tax=Pristionchus pacificus TaxID=54126 RepID=A0A2A6CHP5_PRIPA|nr:hypothetical protein PRIPAC_94808 [Pristionchus pacificus]|eukprot:PDM77607.1 hypothetical protein PRIPAC_34474 [Pristionchus pacificus]